MAVAGKAGRSVSGYDMCPAGLSAGYAMHGSGLPSADCEQYYVLTASGWVTGGPGGAADRGGCHVERCGRDVAAAHAPTQVAAAGEGIRWPGGLSYCCRAFGCAGNNQD